MSETEEEGARFIATFADKQTAIKGHGRREGMRVELTIPESEMEQAIRLFLWRDMLLDVWVKPSAVKREFGVKGGKGEADAGFVVRKRRANLKEVKGT